MATQPHVGVVLGYQRICKASRVAARPRATEMTSFIIHVLVHGIAVSGIMSDHGELINRGRRRDTRDCSNLHALFQPSTYWYWYCR